MKSSRFISPFVVIASIAITTGLFWKRLTAPAPSARLARWPDAAHVAPPEPPPPPPSAPSTTPPSPASKTECPSGMVLVDGEHCPFVAHKCKKKRPDSDVCEVYVPEVLCEGTIRPARFCVDTFEYPDMVGVEPAVLVSFKEAERACEVEDKRLCTVDEWQFACEGEAILPLPVGLERSSTTCNVDHTDRPPMLGAMRDAFEVAGEMLRVDGRVPSGSLPCASPFGVRDLSGNVEEWVDNPNGSGKEKPFRSSIAGGYWGQGPAACRDLDTSVPSSAASYKRGFRCCSDAAPSLRAPSKPHRAPGGFRSIGKGA